MNGEPDKGVLVDLPMVVIDCKDIVINDKFWDALNFVEKLYVAVKYFLLAFFLIYSGKPVE